MPHVFVHALLDSLKILPWVFAVYVFIEFIERRVSVFKNGKFLSGKKGPLIGSLAGAIPQCGVSVMSSKLYEKNLISTGTLMAVFIATSDEAFVLLLSSGKFLSLLVLLISKIAFALIVGYSINILFKRKEKTNNGEAVFDHEEICAHCHHDDEEDHGKLHSFVLVPLWHTITTFLFVFVVNFLFGLLVHWVGEEKIMQFMRNSAFYQPFIVALVGLIPNCASSVLTTQLYLNGGITFGSLFAGLSVNAGIGIAILLKDTKNIKRNVIIVVALYVIGSLGGLLISLF